jgi:hypothetical protein
MIISNQPLTPEQLPRCQLFGYADDWDAEIFADFLVPHIQAFALNQRISKY